MRIFFPFRLSTAVLWAIFMAAQTGGCTSMMAGAREPQVRTINVTDGTGVAFDKALRAATELGIEVKYVDRAQCVFQGHWKGAVQMTVLVYADPTRQRSTIEASAKIMPGKVAFGAFKEADEFISHLQQTAYAGVR